MTKTRIEAFTDAVIAIIMTILVLELPEPKGDTFLAFFHMSHKLVIYVISFVTLAIYWNNHHHMFQLVHKIDGRVLWANNLLIFCLSLLPFSTAWMGDYLFSFAPQFFYGLVFLGANAAYYLLVNMLVRANGKDSEVGQTLQRYRKLYLSIGLNILALILGLIAPILILITDVLVLLLWIVPEKKAERNLH